MNGQRTQSQILDEIALLRPETSLQPDNLDTVRIIVNTHLPEDARPRESWVRRWFTNPEPAVPPAGWKYEPEDHYAIVETPEVDSLVSRLNEAHLDAIMETRREAARVAVLGVALQLETHLENLSNETMIDTVVRSATQDCVDIVRNLLGSLHESESGGA